MPVDNCLIISGNGNYSYYILDLISKQIIYKKEKISELVSQFEKGRPAFRPFGLTTDENNIYVASNDKIAVFNKGTNNFERSLDIPAFVNTHQILKHKNVLYVCHTANNCIGIHDLEKNENLFYKFPECKIIYNLPTPNDVYQYDTVHVNSLCLKNNKLYFCLHYRGERKSKFGYIDLATMKTEWIFDGGISCHNIKIIDNKLYTLSTHEGKLLIFNLESKILQNFLLVNPNELFLRGMELYENKLLIFCSNLHETEFIIPPLIKSFNLDDSSIENFIELKEPGIITDCCLI